MELLVMALAVVLLQLFINWISFLSALPILTIALIVLVIAATRQDDDL
jgi:hypothetical protein